ncbi:uncharacterized [Tachysurus ichikawai]
MGRGRLGTPARMINNGVDVETAEEASPWAGLQRGHNKLVTKPYAPAAQYDNEHVVYPLSHSGDGRRSITQGERGVWRQACCGERLPRPEMPINLPCMSLDRGRKPEYP